MQGSDNRFNSPTRHRFEEEQFQIRIARDLAEVDVVGEEIDDGGDEARFSGAGGTVQKEALLPDTTEAVVVPFRSEEGFEIRFDLVFAI